MKEGVDFHLFITTSPCGDARIFSLHEAPSGDKKEREMAKVDSSAALAKIVEEPETGNGPDAPDVGSKEQTAKPDQDQVSNEPAKNDSEDSLLDGNTSLEEVAKKLESMNLPGVNQDEDRGKFESGATAEEDEGVMVEDATEEVNNNEEGAKVVSESNSVTDLTSAMAQFSLGSTPAVSGSSTPATNPKGDGYEEEEEFKVPPGLNIPTIVIDQYEEKEGRKDKSAQDASR